MKYLHKYDKNNASSRHKLRTRSISALITLCLILAAMMVPNAAYAYTTTGCKWPATSLRIDYRYVNGNFRTAINLARDNYNNATDVTLSTVDLSGPTFTAQNSNYGATGWEAQANWNCALFGNTTSASIKANQYYLSGSEPVTRLKVVWAHEIGHALGLNHSTTVARVMYTSASQAYFAGVTGLTSDEINGINALY